MSHYLTIFLLIISLSGGVFTYCLSSERCIPIHSCKTLNRRSIIFTCRNGRDLSGVCCPKQHQVPQKLVRRPKILDSNASSSLQNPDSVKILDNYTSSSHVKNPDPKLHKSFSLLPENCGTTDRIGVPTDRIEEGVDTEKGEHPWMAYILVRMVQQKATSHCSGSILNHRYILTAAHCAAGCNASQFSVFVGLESLNCVSNGLECPPEVQQSGVEAVIVHESYLANRGARHQANDIALLRTEKPLEFNTFVKAVCVPFDEILRKSLYRRNLTLIGWGSDGRGSRELQKIPVRFISSEECARLWNTPLLQLLKSQICILGENLSRPTKGDSGGPLLIKDSRDITYVVGITSFGHPKRRELPVILVRLGKFIEWILDKMQQ